MRRAARCLTLVALVCVAAPRAVAAQAATVLTATADVNTTALTSVVVNNLAIGVVVPGVVTTIHARTNPNAAYIIIQGAQNAQIAISFTLPTVLRAGLGPHTMPITFIASSACDRRQPGQSGCTTFNPNNGDNIRIRNQAAPNNHAHVWVGGRVTPSPTQQPGVYTATITMSVAYTGN